MKKIIFTLLFLFITVGLFGDTGTGYNNLNWNTPRDRVAFGENTEYWKEGNIEIASFTDVVIGQSTIKSYIFTNGKFNGVTYFYFQKDTEELLERFNNKKKIFEKFVDVALEGEVTSTLEYIELPDYAKKDENGKRAFEIIIAESMIWEIAKMTEEDGYKSIDESKEQNTKLYIFDYNEDTRVYILTGGLYNVGFVAYVPHRQDY